MVRIPPDETEWRQAARLYVPGTNTAVVVSDIVPFGLFVRLAGANVPCVILPTGFSDATHFQQRADLHPVGASLTVRIVGFDEGRLRVSAAIVSDDEPGYRTRVSGDLLVDGLPAAIEPGHVSTVFVFESDENDGTPLHLGAVVEQVLRGGQLGESFEAVVRFWAENARGIAAPGASFEMRNGRRSVGRGRILESTNPGPGTAWE